MRVTFLVDDFPAPSVTFIQDRIIGLLERGVDVEIVAAWPATDSVEHAEVRVHDLRSRTRYIGMPRAKPRRLARALAFAGAHARHVPNLLGTLRSGRYGRDAASLRLFFTAGLFLDHPPTDILHCQFGPNGIIGAALIELGIVEARLITTFHGYGIRLGLEHGAQMYDVLRARADRVISISGYNRRHLLEFGFTAAQLVDLPVGIRLDLFPCRWDRPDALVAPEAPTAPLAPVAPAGSDRPLRILSVGSLIGVKGHEFGIRAIEILAARHPERRLRYVIAGGGSRWAELERLVRERGLADVVEFRGALSRDEVRRELAAADLFLMPSVAEATPVALMEAQAVGLPVVATDVGAVAEVVVDGESGLLVEPGDAGAIAAKLERLMAEPAAWETMGRRGRAHVEAHYDIDRQNDRLVEIYRDVLREGETPRRS